MKVFVYTEVFNCGIIGKKCLESFFKYHKGTKVHVIGTQKDFKEVGEFSDVEYVDLSNDETLKQLYSNGGHSGTAYIFAKVLKKHFGDYDYVIHFDSDVIFRNECVGDILKQFENGYDLVGPRRIYKNNIANTNGIFNDKQDVVGTYFFGYNINKVSNYDFNTIHSMIIGQNPIGFSVIDFFDSISFDILKNNGKIFYFDFKKYGAWDENGSTKNGFDELNRIMDFGENIAHFAGIGSGRNFVVNGIGGVAKSYAKWAIKRYAIYMKVFYDEDIKIYYDENEYNIIKNKFKNV